MKKSEKLEAKINAINDMQELRTKQNSGTGFVKGLWGNKFKLLIIVYMIARFVKDLIVIKLLKG